MLPRQSHHQHPPLSKNAFWISLRVTLALWLAFWLTLWLILCGIKPLNEAIGTGLNNSKRLLIQAAHAQDVPEPTPTDPPERKPRRDPKPTTAQKK